VASALLEDENLQPRILVQRTVHQQGREEAAEVAVAVEG
jgi:hypothetical protein